VILSLDTNVFVDLIRRRQPMVRSRYDEAVLADASIVTSLIVYHELQFGIAASQDPTAAAFKMGEALQDVVVEPLTEDDVIVAARVRAALKLRGEPIGPYDLLIAGQALARGWTLVTSNVREFERVDGLSVQNWAA
jgi:tRNA(fMet)-specific endonuclease VapC